jgi:membrane-associated phospholipid phosphatase
MDMARTRLSRAHRYVREAWENVDLGRVPEAVLNVALWSYLAFILITLDVISSGPLRQVDEAIARMQWQQSSDTLDVLAYWLDNIGQRGLTAPILLAVAVTISVRIRWWRPLRLALLGLISLNLSVGAVKVLVGRTSPRTGVDELMAGGFMYVSGHAANAALTWGLLAYLVHRFTGVSRVISEAVVSLALVFTTLMVLVSLYRNTHWLTDLVGGVLVGGTLLALVIAVDRGLVRVPHDATQPMGVSSSMTADLSIEHASAERASATSDGGGPDPSDSPAAAA